MLQNAVKYNWCHMSYWCYSPRCKPHHQVARAQCIVVRKALKKTEKITTSILNWILKYFSIPSVWMHWGSWGGVCDSRGWRVLCQPWPAHWQSSAWHRDCGTRPTEADPDIKEVLGGEWISKQIWECSGIWIMSRFKAASLVYFVTKNYWNLICALPQHLSKAL